MCDGLGHQVSFGIAEELLKLSISEGAEASYPENWLEQKGPRTKSEKRYETRYNPQLFAVLAEKLLLESGVTIMYGTYAVGVNMKDDKIQHIITENKSGRRAYAVKSVVDATGDCDIAKFANVPTKEFHQGNILAAWYYSVGKAGYKLNTVGFADIPDDEKNEENCVELLSEKRFSGLDGDI